MTDYTAIRRVFAGILNGIPDIPAIAWANVKYTPEVGTPYIAENLLIGDTAPIGLAFDSASDTVGVYQLTINISTNITSFPALELADTLRESFARGIHTDSTTGQKVEITRVGANPMQTDAPWVSLPISVTFRAIN